MGIEQSIEVILGELSEVKEILQELRSPQKNPEPADRCQLKDACEITGLSKAAIYKLTHEIWLSLSIQQEKARCLGR